MKANQFLERLQGVKKTAHGWQARCPAHADKSPSLSVSEGDAGRILLKCFAGCSVESVCAAAGVKLADLFPADARPARNGKGKIVAEHDYRDESGTLLFQVCRFEPKDFRQRKPDGNGGWTWKLEGVRRVLFRLPDVLKAKAAGHPVIVTEGEKDALALAQRGFCATCNPGGAGKWLDAYTETLRGASVFILPDNDKPGQEHAALVARALQGKAASVRVATLPAELNGRNLKDAFAYFAAGGTPAALSELLDAAPDWTPTPPNSSTCGLENVETTAPEVSPLPKLTLRSPDEILAMRFDDSDVILGDRLLAIGQQLVIAAASGTGKSRLLFLLAAACVAGRKFLAFNTGAPLLRWLILQTENSNRRLQSDLARIKAWLGDDWPKFNSQVVIHTLENDLDGVVAIDDPEARLAITDAITQARADVVCFDPLNDFGSGDLNKDSDMKATLQTLSRLCRRGNPHRAIVVLHHAITGKGGAVKVTGYDRASFARNSKVLHAWTRGQINLAPADADSNDRLIVACGKCSNGREFQTFAARLNPDSLIYECDASLDVAAWEKEISGQASREPLMAPERVKELCRQPMTKAELAHAIREDCGCARQVAYRYIKRAEQAGKIRFNKSNENFTAK